MSHGYPLVVLATILGLAAYCVSHVLLARCFRTASPYPPLLAGFVPGLLVASAATIAGLIELQASRADWIGYGGLNFVTYTALAWGYFHFVNLCIASLRIRVLEEVLEQGGATTARHLLAHYNDDQLIAARIDRLVTGGHLRINDGCYVIGKPYFLWTAMMFAGLRRIILG